MKKNKLLSLVVMFLILLFVSARPVSAKEMPKVDIPFKDGTTLTYEVTTKHEYYGEIEFSNLYFNDGTLCKNDFSIFVVDDTVKNFKQSLYTSKRPVDFYMDQAIALPYMADGNVYFSADIGGYSVNTSATKKNPNVLSLAKKSTEGSFAEPIGQYFYLYDSDWNGTYWLCIGTIVFTQSQVESYQKTGKLPNNELYKAMGDEQLREVLSNIVIKKSKTVKATGITLDQSKVTLNVGKTVTLKATIAPKSTTSKTVSWKSSNTKVATVDKNGKVTAKKAGTVTITATTTDGSNKNATSKITVKK